MTANAANSKMLDELVLTQSGELVRNRELSWEEEERFLGLGVPVLVSTKPDVKAEPIGRSVVLRVSGGLASLRNATAHGTAIEEVTRKIGVEPNAYQVTSAYLSHYNPTATVQYYRVEGIRYTTINIWGLAGDRRRRN